MNAGIIKKSAIYLVGNFSSKILMAIIIPIYAFYVQSSDLGYFDYSQTIMYIAVPIAFFSVWEAILKFTIDDKYQKSDIINSAILLSIGACSLITVGVLVADLIFDIQHLAYIALMFVTYGLVQIWQYAARGLDSSKVYVASGIVGTVVNFGAILVLVVWMKIGLHGLFISYILSQVATFFTIELKLHLLGGIRIRRDSLGLLKKMAIFSAPLTLNSISGWLFTGFSRVVINSRLGTYENGLYAFANKFAIVISMLGTVITMAVVEEAIIASKDKSKSASEGKNTSELYVAVISVATAVIPAIKLFYDLIAESEYYSSFIYVPFLLLYASLITLASNIGAQFQALEITKYQFITTVIGSAVTVALSLIFVDRYGVIAVIIAQVVGAVVMAISRYVIVKRYIPYKMGWLKMLLSTAVYVILSILCLNATPLIACLLMLLAIIAMAAFNYKVILAFVKRKKTTDQV